MNQLLLRRRCGPATEHATRVSITSAPPRRLGRGAQIRPKSSLIRGLPHVNESDTIGIGGLNPGSGRTAATRIRTRETGNNAKQFTTIVRRLDGAGAGQERSRRDRRGGCHWKGSQRLGGPRCRCAGDRLGRRPGGTANCRYFRLERLCRRLPFAHFSGLSRPARNDQPAGRACRRGLWLRPRHSPDHRAKEARRSDLRVRSLRPHVSRRGVRSLQGRSRRQCRTSWSARFQRSSRCWRPSRFPCSEWRATRPTTFWRPSLKICDAAGAKCFIVSGDKDCRQLITDRVAVYNIRKDEVFDAAALARRVGRPAGSGRRFPGPGRRQGRQRARRAHDRAEDRLGVAAAITTRSTICLSTRAKLPARKGRNWSKAASRRF